MAQFSAKCVNVQTPPRTQNTIIDRLLQRLYQGEVPGYVTVIVGKPMNGWTVAEDFSKGFTCSLDFVCAATDKPAITMTGIRQDKQPTSKALERHWRKTGEHIQMAMDEVGQEIALAALNS